MNLLLDTHAFLWFLGNDPQLSATDKSLIEDPVNRKFVSIATCWEIAIKVGLKKLDLGEPATTFLPRELAANHFDLLGIELRHATFVETLPLHQVQTLAGLPGPESPISGSVARLLDRLRTTIAEIGYEAVIEDLSSPELVGGDDSLLASDEVMVIPGYLADESRPILLAVTKGWSGKEPYSFAKVMRQVKIRLVESRGAIQVVIVFCGCWDSTSFEEEHREELGAHAKNGIHFLFVLVGNPDRVFVPVPVEFDQSPR